MENSTTTYYTFFENIHTENMKPCLKIFVVGEPSIDHILTLLPKARSFMDEENGTWRLERGTYFSFVANDKIYKIFAGRKWPNNTLLLGEKHTLTREDKGYVEILKYTPEYWTHILHDKHAIPAENYRQQIGGPARNSLFTIMNINNNAKLFSTKPILFSCLFLGGYDEPTQEYERDMNNLFIEGSSLSTIWLKDPNWTVHEAFSFVQPYAFRTMIRYQEKRKFFDPSIVQTWFRQNRQMLLGQDILYINSLKNADLIEACADIAKEFRGKIIIAPTNDMLMKSLQTRDIMNIADIIICNIEEFCTIMREPYSKKISLSDQQQLLLKFMSGLKATRLYVSGGGGVSWSVERKANHLSVFSLEANKIPCRQNINAGDTWTGAILSQEFSDEIKSAHEILRWATTFTTTRLAESEEKKFSLLSALSYQSKAVEVYK